MKNREQKSREKMEFVVEGGKWRKFWWSLGLFSSSYQNIISPNSRENEKEKFAKILGQKNSCHASSISRFLTFFCLFATC